MNKTVSTDTMTAQGACWSQWHHPDGDHGVDAEPCPCTPPPRSHSCLGCILLKLACSGTAYPFLLRTGIRRFWDLDALSATRNLDKLISMGTCEAPMTMTMSPLSSVGLSLCGLVVVFFRHPHDSTPLLACRRSLPQVTQA